MLTLSKKVLHRWSMLALVVFAILGLVVLTDAKERTRGRPLESRNNNSAVVVPDVNAAELVRAVRESENWIHHINSLYLRIESKVTSTSEEIAARRAKLKKQFPDSDLDPNRFTGLKPSEAGFLEFAFDHHRVRYLRHVYGDWRSLRIWGGKQFVAHTKYFSHEQENYYVNSTIEERQFHEFIALDTSWPRAQPHSFWFDPKDAGRSLKYYGFPEDFVLTGRADYRGHECYILDCDRSMMPDMIAGLSYRWYVGVRDNLLYGKKSLVKGNPRWEHWMSDYKEISPGCYLPMTQGVEHYKKGDDDEPFLDFRREFKVVEVRINEKLPNELFEVKFKEGVTVGDERFGGYVVYPYKANRTDEEWQEIREKARKRAERDAGEKQVKDALVGKPAPPFPENAKWLNSKPLTWKDLQGKVVILDFWAEWCGPCRNDLPVMSGLHKEREKSGIVVIGIHTPGSEIEDIQNLMKKYNLGYPICIDTPVPPGGKSWGEMSSQYGVNAIPYAFVIDQQGDVAGHDWGVTHVLGKAHELVGN